MTLNKPLYHIHWTLQLIVGAGLFTVSFVIEYTVLQSFFGTTALLALFLAAFLEVSKGLAICWHHFLTLDDTPKYPVTTQTVSRLFRSGLVFLSIFCSLTYLGVRLDRPALEAIKAKDLQQLEVETTKARERLERRVQKVLDQQQQTTALGALLTTAKNRVRKLSEQLDHEMNNVVKGEFIGKRYRAIEKRLANAKQEEAQLIEQLTTHNSRDTATQQQQIDRILTEGDKKISTRYEQRKLPIQRASYATDDRVQHPMIASLTNTFKAALGWSPEPLQFVFGFSIFLSTLIELGIILAFETVTLAIFPLLKTQYQSEMETAMVETRFYNRSKQEKIKHKATTDQILHSFNKTRDAAQRVMGKA